MSDAGRLEGKIALVTGAGNGIGEAIARCFARHGAHVIVNDIRAEEGQAVTDDIGDRAEFVRFDVTDADAWDAAMTDIVARYGGLDVLVNNAGMGNSGRIEQASVELHRKQIDVNFTGVWLGIRAAVSAMKAGGGGSIVSISSIDGLVGVEGMSTYVGTKFAVTGMTRSLALELGPDNIRVNSVHPGITETPMLMAHWPLPERINRAIARQPIARLGRPEEIANAVLFFACEESSFCTGTSLVVDGGHIAGPFRDAF